MSKKQVAEKQSTDVAVVDWEQEMAVAAKAVAKTERVSTNRISTQSGVLSYMDQALPDNELECIILASAWEHTYYTERYKKGEIRPPACFALGLPDAEGNAPIMYPHEDVPDPQASACKSCVRFEWGSDPDGGRGKACKEKRRIALIPAPSAPEEIEGSEMALMTVPVMSVKNWAGYVNTIAAMYQRPSWGMLSKVKLVPDPRSQFKVVFEPIDVLGPDYLPHVHARLEAATNALMTPFEMNPEQEQEEEGDKKY